MRMENSSTWMAECSFNTDRNNLIIGVQINQFTDWNPQYITHCRVRTRFFFIYFSTVLEQFPTPFFLKHVTGSVQRNPNNWSWCCGTRTHFPYKVIIKTRLVVTNQFNHWEVTFCFVAGFQAQDCCTATLCRNGEKKNTICSCSLKQWANSAAGGIKKNSLAQTTTNLPRWSGNNSQYWAKRCLLLWGFWLGSLVEPSGSPNKTSYGT